MNKKIVLVILFVFAGLSANATVFLGNIAYKIMPVQEFGLESHNLGLQGILSTGNNWGVYLQLGFLFNTKLSGDNVLDPGKLYIVDLKISYSISGMIGVGKQLHAGIFTLLLGTGLYIDYFHYSAFNANDFSNLAQLLEQASMGLGLGINGIISPGGADGNFILNLGVLGAWHPFSIKTGNFLADQVSLTLQIGLGYKDAY